MKVGITGHQNIGSQDTIKWTTENLKEIIQEANIDLGITCLARGADQLYAELIQNYHIPYIAIIASKDYQKTFTDMTSLKTFESLIKTAKEVKILDYEKANEQAFFDAGKLMVDNSDMIIAVWDGKPAKGLGGTGDVVRYAIEMKKKIIHINTLDHKVSVIND
jgi:hypothetical protein